MTNRIYGGLDGDYLFKCAVASRQNPKITSIYMYGHNPSVTAGAMEDLWEVGGTRVEDYTPVVISSVSTSADDAAGGTGAQMIRIDGLDANGDAITEMVMMNGLTPVLTTQVFSFVLRTLVILSGSSGNAIGNITSSAGGNDQALILPSYNYSSGAFYRVPRGYTGFFTDTYVSGGPNDDFVADYQVKAAGTNTFISIASIEISNSNLYSASYAPPTGPIAELMIIKVRCIGVSNNVNARGSFNITIIRNDYLASLVSLV
jgi:hypothetical protein